jgi:hypothetical protein
MPKEKLRSVNTGMWDDNWFASLNTDEKVIFLYLITNHKTNMLGIFEITIGLISFQTKVPIDDVKDILNKFITDGKIRILGNYIILINFNRHQKYNLNMKKSAIEYYNNLDRLNCGDKYNMPLFDKERKDDYGKVIDEIFNTIIQKINHWKGLGNHLEPLGNHSEIEVELESELEVEVEVEIKKEVELEVEKELEIQKELESEIQKELESKINQEIVIEDFIPKISSVDDCLVYFQYRNKKITKQMLHYVINTQNDDNLIKIIGEDNWDSNDIKVSARLVGYKII